MGAKCFFYYFSIEKALHPRGFVDRTPAGSKAATNLGSHNIESLQKRHARTPRERIPAMHKRRDPPASRRRLAIAGATVYRLLTKDQGRTMRAIVFVAIFVGCLCGPSRAYDLETKRGQAVCDTLAEFEELSIAIGMADDRYIEEMGNKGCHFPEAGLKMALIEAYTDQTVLLFQKLADNTRLGPVPDHIDRLTSLAKVRLFFPDHDPVVGFTLLPVSHRTSSEGNSDAAN
jgi:hypothetical protein